MDINEIKGKFNVLKGNFKQKWGELTDDGWKRIGGNKDKLLGILQQKYGRSKEQTQREVDAFSKEEDERRASWNGGNMSRKVTQLKENMEDGNVETISTEDISRTTKDTLGKIVDTLNDNKLLIGALAAACGVAIYLFATESGKRLRIDIQDKALDIYDQVSEQTANAVERFREAAQKGMSEQEPVQTNIRRIA